MDKLCDMVNELLQSSNGLWLKLRNMEDAMSRFDPALMTAVNGEQHASSVDIDATHCEPETCMSNGSSRPVSVNSSGGALTPPKTSMDMREPFPRVSAFEELLHRSRLYQHAAGRHSETSLGDDGRSALAISIGSSMTLGEVSQISVYALPIYSNELSNPECYEFTRGLYMSQILGISAEKLQQKKQINAEPADTRTIHGGRRLQSWLNNFRRQPLE